VHRVVKQFAPLALVVALSLVAASCGGRKGGDGSPSDVAATVNGQKIMLSEVDRLVNQQAQGQTLPPLELAAARLQVLDKLIERHVLYQRAEKEKTVPSDDEVNTFVDQQKQRGTVEQWEQGLKENNLTEEQVRQEARKDLAINKLQEKLYGKIAVRDQEINDFYANNKERFVTPRGVALADIVVDPRDSAGVFKDDAKSEAEATAKIQRLYQTLKNGADFADVARSSSEDQSAVRGGDIGVADENALRQNGFPQDLIGRFFTQMPIGGYTEPIRFGDGRWYIFKVTNRQLENRPLTLEDPGVRDQIKEALVNQRKTILTEALIRNAMGDATVTNNLAESMLNDPNNLGGFQQATPGRAATPAAAASPAAPGATPAATASPAAASPAATASPSTGATPRAAATAAPAAAATPRPAATPRAVASPAASPRD